MCQRYIQVEFELIYALMIFNRVMRLELKKKKLRNFQGFITYSTIKHMLYYILHLKFWSCAGANYAILKVSGFFFVFLIYNSEACGGWTLLLEASAWMGQYKRPLKLH